MYNSPIPERLKLARKKLGISQKELGIRVGMDESSASGRMNHYEKGRHVPDIQSLKKMANELNVPLNYFFCEDDQSAELAIVIASLSDDEKSLLLKTLKQGSGE
ncbi:helix-turn-helix domain-containing protein [Shewanella aestuarii]|uniref:Helix-turn-helix transcriptional regulator n=1 Tax=Shewanella aestuarii TaxID=1028752 RepID=A0A6G9QJF0_9GAMM|nr:helix-turn-helix transcriptional regulator [Shewanella aestuarii]QIR14680.1 helix-turn-helix transcriptional regulator [Shewanella aestuarii]